eukprot:GHVU01117696.1.p1 GENE.GHVU01117696.1~~GHVU01117696.1.p1  ORF type:complete len:110 (-),score=6.79 GHVU01117696.1:23-352(-)
MEEKQGDRPAEGRWPSPNCPKIPAASQMIVNLTPYRSHYCPTDTFVAVLPVSLLPPSVPQQPPWLFVMQKPEAFTPAYDKTRPEKDGHLPFASVNAGRWVLSTHPSVRP